MKFKLPIISDAVIQKYVIMENKINKYLSLKEGEYLTYVVNFLLLMICLTGLSSMGLLIFVLVKGLLGVLGYVVGFLVKVGVYVTIGGLLGCLACVLIIGISYVIDRVKIYFRKRNGEGENEFGRID